MLSNRNQDTTKRRGNIFFIAWFSEISILRSDRPKFSYRHPYFILIPEIYYIFPSTEWLYVLCFNYLYWLSFLNIRSQDWSLGHQLHIREWEPLHQDWIGEIHNTYKAQWGNHLHDFILILLYILHVGPKFVCSYVIFVVFSLPFMLNINI